MTRLFNVDELVFVETFLLHALDIIYISNGIFYEIILDIHFPWKNNTVSRSLQTKKTYT